jgi:hypothetical protein
MDREPLDSKVEARSPKLREMKQRSQPSAWSSYPEVDFAVLMAGVLAVAMRVNGGRHGGHDDSNRRRRLEHHTLGIGFTNRHITTYKSSQEYQASHVQYAMALVMAKAPKSF